MIGTGQLICFHRLDAAGGKESLESGDGLGEAPGVRDRATQFLDGTGIHVGTGSFGGGTCRAQGSAQHRKGEKKLKLQGNRIDARRPTKGYLLTFFRRRTPDLLNGQEPLKERSVLLEGKP